MAPRRSPLSEVQEVHRDAHLLVLLKPAGLPTTSPEGGDCLARRVQAMVQRPELLHPLSRLDAMVSGLVAFALTREANARALQARKEGRFARCYVGLTDVAPEGEEGQWHWPIAMHGRDPKLRRALEPGEEQPGSKPAHTRYRVVESTQALTALHLWPQTGRTHQLRVHCARAGHPLFGDVAYGGRKRLTLGGGSVLSSRRVQLHCGWLRIPSPAADTGWVELQAPVLPDMAQLWSACGGGEQALRPGPYADRR